MSLLMDALKKAEAAKRQAAPSADDHAAADDAGAAVEPGKPLPELPRELSLLDDQFPSAQTDAAGAGPRPQGSVSAVSENQREREAAHNLFAAKRTASRAPFWIGLSLTTLVAVGAIGTWFWWQLQPRPGGLQPGPALGRGAAAAGGSERASRANSFASRIANAGGCSPAHRSRFAGP